MKAGIGLIGVLLAVAIIFYVAFGMGGKGTVGTTLQEGKKAETAAKEISGLDQRGEKATDSLTFDADAKGVTVNSIVPNGAFDKKFGILPGDVIIQIGPMTRDQISSNSDAQAFLHDAYARNYELIVMRNGQKLSLPRDRHVGATPAPAQTAQPTPPAPADPAKPQPERKNAVGKTQDLINQIQTH